MTTKQKKARELFKKVIAEAKKLRSKNKKLSQPQAVKQAWAIFKSKKIAGSEKHNDTKSHNVRIKVVSGFDMYKIRDTFEKDINSILNKIESYKQRLHNPNIPKNKAERIFLKRMITHEKQTLIVLKKALREQNKLINFSLK